MEEHSIENWSDLQLMAILSLRSYKQSPGEAIREFIEYDFPIEEINQTVWECYNEIVDEYILDAMSADEFDAWGSSSEGNTPVVIHVDKYDTSSPRSVCGGDSKQAGTIKLQPPSADTHIYHPRMHADGRRFAFTLAPDWSNCDECRRRFQ